MYNSNGNLIVLPDPMARFYVTMACSVVQSLRAEFIDDYEIIIFDSMPTDRKIEVLKFVTKALVNPDFPAPEASTYLNAVAYVPIEHMLLGVLGEVLQQKNPSEFGDVVCYDFRFMALNTWVDLKYSISFVWKLEQYALDLRRQGKSILDNPEVWQSFEYPLSVDELDKERWMSLVEVFADFLFDDRDWQLYDYFGEAALKDEFIVSSMGVQASEPFVDLLGLCSSQEWEAILDKFCIPNIESQVVITQQEIDDLNKKIANLQSEVLLRVGALTDGEIAAGGEYYDPFSASRDAASDQS